MKSKILIIVDPQNDFIEGGSLAVSGAKNAMELLSDFVAQNSENYSKIFVTQDFHPENHCSFVENGGIWPKHCVANTFGSALYPKLAEVLEGKNVDFNFKGTAVDVDQYSVFALSDGNITNMDGLKIFDFLCKNDGEIEICGIAGDVCVMNTLNDLLTLCKGRKFRILSKFTASLDGGVKLTEFAEKNNVELVK